MHIPPQAFPCCLSSGCKVQLEGKEACQIWQQQPQRHQRRNHTPVKAKDSVPRQQWVRVCQAGQHAMGGPGTCHCLNSQEAQIPAQASVVTHAVHATIGMISIIYCNTCTIEARRLYLSSSKVGSLHSNAGSEHETLVEVHFLASKAFKCHEMQPPAVLSGAARGPCGGAHMAWLRAPMQVPSHRQWWSCVSTQRSQAVQWCARSRWKAPQRSHGRPGIPGVSHHANDLEDPCMSAGHH